jgi:glycosyltransferase involved in cell wall biosynthesis
VRKRVLIIFPDLWVAFSPSTVNLYDALAESCDVTILAREPEFFSQQRLLNRNVEYVPVSGFMRRLAGYGERLAKKAGRKLDSGSWVTALLMLSRARRYQPDIAIGVDFLGLWIAQKCCANAHLLSLEANRNHPFFELVDRERIKSVIIQTDERFEYLFPDRGIRHFLVQNAPVFRPLSKTDAIADQLVFSGTAIPQFGIMACLRFLEEYPQFSLTVHGAMPQPVRAIIARDHQRLLASGRLILDRRYLELDQLSEYLSKFMLGFCLYDFTDRAIDTFNYHTAPSGKLFSYFAAGVPVVCSNVRGLKATADFDAGVMVDEMTPEAIYRAVRSIKSRHADMRNNCLAAAKHFSFDRAIEPFVRFINDQERA